MSYRKDPLSTGHYYHIYNRSIAGYKIFNNQNEFQRFRDAMIFYMASNRLLKFARHLDLSPKNKHQMDFNEDEYQVRIVAYCLMPTHFHLLLEQLRDNGITKYLSSISESYSRYFNIKHKRNGPLWESRFKNVLVGSDEQLIHLTRYIHLNPTSANLVDKPEEWDYSSYSEYVTGEEKICQYKDIINIAPKDYKKFIDDRKDYQRELSKIKSLLIDNYSG